VQANYTRDAAAFSIDVHRELVDAIIRRDPIGALDATIRHYEDYPVFHTQLDGITTERPPTRG
jgi:DNA-binding FadR family transcriptional regulator